MTYFHIFDADALIDDPIKIELHELTPHTLIDVYAQFQDDLGHVWASNAQFQSDARGKVELIAAQPLLGSYQTPDPNGLLWSMRRQPENETFRPVTNSLTPLSVTLTAEEDGKVVATTTLVRRFLSADVSRTDVREDGLIATLFTPLYESSKKTVLVFGGSGGGFSWSHQIASLLASRGCTAVAVAYFDWNGKFGLPAQFTELPLECFAKARDFLAAQTDINLDDLTVIGYSKGAELVLQLATIYPEIKRVIAYLPSSVVWSGFSQGDSIVQSSWSYRGQPVPFADSLYRQFDAHGWRNPEKIKAAFIPVEKIAAPILLISATKDSIWPSAQMANEIMHRLEAGGCTQVRKHLLLDQAGHSLSVPNLPTVAYGDVRRASNAHAETRAWAAVLRFLNLPTG